jgi:hypothetical protein
MFTKMSKTVFSILNVNTLNLVKEISLIKIIMECIHSFTHICCFIWRLETPRIPVETSFRRKLLHLSHLHPEDGRRRFLLQLAIIYRLTRRHIPEDSSLHWHVIENRTSPLSTSCWNIKSYQIWLMPDMSSQPMYIGYIWDKLCRISSITEISKVLN